MPLRLSTGGVRVFDEWRKQRCNSPADGQLVARVLRDIAAGDWQTRWFSYKSPEADVTVVEPRPGLCIHVRLWTDDLAEFTIVWIAEAEALPEE